MPVYQIVKDGEPVLREKAKDIKEVNPSIIRLLNNLKDTLHSTSNGVGLAAPQIGISKRAIIIETEEEGLFEMLNPEILNKEGLEEDWEGCLSCPGVEGLVPRATKIKVKYIDRQGKEQDISAENFLARVIQHEVDHLDGVLFIDKAQVLNQEKPS